MSTDIRKLPILLPIVAAAFFLVAVSATAQEDPQQAASSIDTAAESTQQQQFRPVRTDSPRHTFETFLYLANELDQIALEAGLDTASDDRDAYERTLLIVEQARTLIDLSSLPEGSRDEIGSATVTYLIDIFGRIELPDSESIPGVQVAQMPDSWRVPDTPIRIVRILDGPRRGEYLFDADTHRDAPRFYRGVEDLPLRSEAGIESWTQSLPQITGPIIPARIVQTIPEPLKRLWLGTPIWKILTVSLLMILLSALVVLLHRMLSRDEPKSTVAASARRAVTPLVILLIVWRLEPLIAFELNVSGAFWALLSTILTAITYMAAAWLFWWAMQGAFELLTRLRSPDPERVENPLLVVARQGTAIMGSIVILAAGAQAVGLPVYSIAAGLGIGGLAVALSIRPTLENLIGGVMLYLDQPVRVGDFCTFGDKAGTVERIGIRTIKIRARDRTLITVPNALFADMQLTNWAHCDKMLINATLGLRFETETDQLRYLLVKLREMFHAHPRIESETVRIRFAGFGASSMDVSIRVYALTRDWNEFFAVREDVFLRANDIVTDSGASLAFPSQTLYMTGAQAPDSELANAAVSEVESWRKTGQLPFPSLSASRMDELEGSLDWPPRGSMDAALQEPEAAEPLSAKVDEEQEDGESAKPGTNRST